VVPNQGSIYNTQWCRELIRFSICHWKDIFKMSPKPNCYGFATRCRKLYFSCVGCRRDEKVGNHCIMVWLSIYFTYQVGIIGSYSNRICYRKIAKSRTNDALELHGALRTVFANHFLSSNTTPASYDVCHSLSDYIKPKKHQRLADPLLQSGVVTHNNSF